uniref:DUF4605 domain-containing protein n=1 Tax=Callorhinchus milii TaxID=7868 RepID=V9L1X1_CALMI
MATGAQPPGSGGQGQGQGQAIKKTISDVNETVTEGTQENQVAVEDGEIATERSNDDCKKMGTLFGELNKCLLNAGFSRMELGTYDVEPIVIVFFWFMLGFLGLQALTLVGALSLVIVFIHG